MGAGGTLAAGGKGGGGASGGTAKGGTCKDLQTCCTSMPKGTPATVCIGDYTNSMGMGDAACSVVLMKYRAAGSCK
jgi:hypothetical protein